MNSDASLPCPACGFMVFRSAYGSYTICPVCTWEDDSLQLANPFTRNGANRASLFEAQRRALSAFPLDVMHASGFSRSSAWRPIDEKDGEKFAATDGWKFVAVLGEADAYWSRR